MIIDQTILFLQEWGVVITAFVAIALAMAADLFPKLAIFMNEVDQRYPKALDYLIDRQQKVIDCYERLPARIRTGFALIGGKQAWAWLVKAGYAYLRKKQNG